MGKGKHFKKKRQKIMGNLRQREKNSEVRKKRKGSITSKFLHIR
jgi:hypothetical protein